MRLQPTSLVGLFLAAAVFAFLPACAAAPAAPQPKTWAIALHGGAGTLSKNTPPERRKEYEDALAAALKYGSDRLALGDSALDVCEAVVRILEDDPRFNAGKGAVYNEQGGHELDASIMDGSTLRCGAVAGVRTVRHPVTLARLVMEKTRHVLLAGDGAEKFADGQNIERVPNNWFDTDLRRKQLDEVLQERASKGMSAAGDRGDEGRFDAAGVGPASRLQQPGVARAGDVSHVNLPQATALALDPPPSDVRHTYGTVGCVALDAQGRLVAATSTGGMTGKRWGRIGDAPVIGAGNYADRFVAVSCTGTGEQFLRHVVAKSISARVEHAGASLDDAVAALVDRTLQPGDGGVIAVDRLGNVVARFNSEGMYRGMADATGRFEVGIF